MISDKMRPNFAVLLTLAWALVAVWLLAQFWSDAATRITDPDDAMRLVQVREFLAGKGWFDLGELRVDPPYGYFTHWSRLIDAGLAGVFLLARFFVDGAAAEHVMVAVWPLLWLLPVMGGAAAIAWRCGGRDAALLSLILAVFGLPAFQHFQPGRIDHHNVQITLAIVAVAAAAWSDRVAWASIAAGFAGALALAVGLESLPWVVIAGAAIALRFVFDSEAATALRNYGLSLAAGTSVLFFGTVGPAHWFVSACDALALNFVMPVVVAGVLLAVAAPFFARGSVALRLAAVAICAAVALGIFIGFEPRCVSGPFALIDPIVRPIWLAEVREMEPLAVLFAKSPVMGAWVAAFPVFAMAAALWLLSGAARRDFGTLIAIASLVVAFALTLSMVKAYSYAMWFAMPVVAAAVAISFSQFEVRRPLRWLSVAIFTPIAISAVAISVAQAARPMPPEDIAKARVCYEIDAYEALKKLEPGLIAADVDLGPMLLAFTDHSVLAAPYHRISHGIIAVNRVFSSSAAEANKTLIETRADYVVLCGASKPTVLDGRARSDSFWAQLVANDVPQWLERVAMPSNNPFVVYRLKP